MFQIPHALGQAAYNNKTTHILTITSAIGGNTGTGVCARKKLFIYAYCGIQLLQCNELLHIRGRIMISDFISRRYICT